MLKEAIEKVKTLSSQNLEKAFPTVNHNLEVYELVFLIANILPQDRDLIKFTYDSACLAEKSDFSDVDD